jgi:hypothetical protein
VDLHNTAKLDDNGNRLENDRAQVLGRVCSLVLACPGQGERSQYHDFHAGSEIAATDSDEALRNQRQARVALFMPLDEIPADDGP